MLALDAFRGLACAAVLVYHYMHFVYAGHASSAAFAPALKGLYLHGWLGVDAFFCLSGFIFGKLYGDRIAERRISARDFFIARLSRLYPMIIATLVPAAILLALFTAQTGTHFLHQDHDTQLAFVGELLMVRQWFSGSFAFNRSAWSISIEVLMYLLFFASRRALPRHALMLSAGFIVLAVAGRHVVDLPVVRGLFGFFWGVAAFEAMRLVRAARWRRAPMFAALILAAALVVSIGGCARVMRWDVEEWNFGTIFFADLGFTALIVMASTVTVANARYAALCEWAGAVSYPAYLVHVPIQLVILVVVRRFGIIVPADQPWFWFAYMALVIGTAACAHYAYEVPVREWIRHKQWNAATSIAVG